MGINSRGKLGGPITPVYIVSQADGINVETVAIDAAYRDGLYWQRQGNGVCKYLNDNTPGVAQIVLTAAGLVYNLAAGTAIFITQYCYAVESVNDNCIFEFGWCDAADGGGTFTPIGPQKRVYTGAAWQGRTAFDQDVLPAGRFAYSDGVRSITFRVDANDASAVITVGYHGWWEPEI